MTTQTDMSSRTRLVWHRRDLRLIDNPLYQGLTDMHRLQNGCADGNDSSLSRVLSLYVFDESFFLPRPSTCNPTSWDAVSNGPHTCRLLVEAVHELRNCIRSIGGELIVRIGNPASIIPEIASQIDATEVWWSEEPGTYEKLISRSVRNNILKGEMSSRNLQNNLGTRKIPKIVTKMGYTLYHPDDLPRDSNEWSRLAHPKQPQRNNKRKKRLQKHATSLCSSLSSAAKVSLQHQNETEQLHDNTLVDVSCERFEGMSRIVGDFRKAARASTSVRCALPSPSNLRLPPRHLLNGVEVGDIPTLEDLITPLMSTHRHRNYHRPILGLHPKLIDRVVTSALSRHLENSSDIAVNKGGESHAIKRLHEFVNEGHAATAKRSLADVSGNNSSKLAVHLALGTLSPRTVYETVKEREEDNDGCQWLVSHLEMRDFFLFLTLASDSQLFRLEGMPVGKKHVPPQWYNPATSAVSGTSNNKQRQWEQWASGETGLPLVDAAMKELVATGYCSNRVRQNAASVLTKDLKIDWRAGAEWFQFLLEDHCVGANWGNWLYFSGVGPDPKNRHFRTISQALRYDPDGAYVQKWLPSLRGIKEKETLFRPWDFVNNWNEVIVSPKTQLTWQDMQRLEQTGKLLEYLNQ